MSDFDCIRMHLEIAEVAKRTQSDMPSIVNFKDALSRLETLRAELATTKELAQLRLRHQEAAVERCGCVIAELAAAQTRIAALERALATCDAALEKIETAANQGRDDAIDDRGLPVDLGDAFKFERVAEIAREARRAAKAALDE